MRLSDCALLYGAGLPCLAQETDEAPIDYNPLLNDMLKSTGQEVADEPEEGAAGPKLDLVQLYWWDCDFSDYVKAAKTILATGKVRDQQLAVPFPGRHHAGPAGRRVLDTHLST